MARGLVAAGHAVTVLARGGAAGAAGAESLLADRLDADAAGLTRALTGRPFDLTVDLLAYTAADVARVLDVPGFVPGRYVMISTGQVYLVAAERRPPFREVDAALPAMPEPVAGTRDHGNWEYGVGKRGAEVEVMRRRAAGLDTLLLRLPVVQGAQDRSRRLWAYLERLRDGGPLLLPGGGVDPVRYVWAEDVARFVAGLAAGMVTPSPAYNLAMPEETTLAALVAALASELGVAPRVVAVDETAAIAAGVDPWFSPFSGPWCSRPDPALAAAELGFRCTPVAGWLPSVVRAHLAEAAAGPVASHFAYAGRAAERAFVGG